jgi:single-strand DNA-binding protein
MLGYTKIQIMGNLGGMPEMKFLPSGDPVVNFSVAVNRRYKDRDGNQKEATDWFRVCAFNGVGEACAKHLQKGDGIFVEGRLQVRQYDSKQTGKEVSVEIIPSTVRFLGSGRSDAERPAAGKEPANAEHRAEHGADGVDEDVPF